MWHEARKQEKKLRVMIVDYRKRAERRREFYEKFKADPTQFMQVHGRPSKIYLEPQIAASAENCMMPWQGNADNMIDRFDVRAHLDIIPEYHSSSSTSTKSAAVEEEEANPGINYERYRILIQNDLSGITEDKFLHQIHLEEQFGTNATTHSQIFGKNLQPKASKAAIGYTYEDSTPAFSTAPLVPPKGPASVTEADEESEEEIDFDLLVNVDDLTHGQKAELNTFGTKYGLGVGEFMEYLNGDLEEKERMRLAKLQEEEKQAMSGRKARRERRAYKDKLIMRKGYISPPSYATYASPADDEPSSRRSSSRSESRSRSRSRSASREKITFITSFGGNESDEGGTNSSNKAHDSKYSLTTTSSKKDKDGHVFGPTMSQVDIKGVAKGGYGRRRSRSRSRSPYGGGRRRRSRSHSSRRRYRRRSRSKSKSRSSSRGRRRRRRSSSSSRSRSRSRRHYRRRKRSSSSSSRSRSRSRGRGRKRRNSSRSRSSKDRSRSRDGRRKSRRKSRSRSRSSKRSGRRSRSRSRGRHHRSRSSSRRRRRRSRSSSTSVSSPAKGSKGKRSSTSSSPVFRRSKSKDLPPTTTKESDNGLEIVGVAITKEPSPPPPPIRRYYGRRSSSSDSSISLSGNESDGGSKKNGNQNHNKRDESDSLHPKGKTGLGSTSKEDGLLLAGLTSAGTSGSSSSQSVAKLTPKERLRRKMQSALSKTFRADKEAEKQRLAKMNQERMEREESLRELTIKYRRREREKRHRERSSSTSSSGSYRSRSRSPGSPRRRRISRSSSKSPYRV